MTSDLTKISSIAEVFDGPPATPKKTEIGPYFLSISSLEEGRLDLSKSAHLSEEQFKTWTRRVTPEEGDVLFSYETRLGEAAMMPPGVRACLGRRMGLLRPRRDKVIPEYLLYAYIAPTFQTEIKKRTIHGATVERIALKELPDFPIRIPSLDEQRFVVEFLQSLDDKIELNRRMNRTLEAMAQAIFKSWFVDFEPTRAKVEASRRWHEQHARPSPQPSPSGRGRNEAEGEGSCRSSESLRKAQERAAMAAIAGKTEAELDQLSGPQQQSLAQIAALFPNTFQDSELGEIPEGWEFSTIGKETDTVGGATPSTKNPEFWENGEHHWVTPKDFSSLQDKVLLSSSRKITDAGLKKISSGLLPVGSVLMSSRAPVGYLAISKIETAINQGFIAMKCDGRLSAEYVLHWANSEMDNIKQSASGSTFAEISKKTFRPFPVIVPTSDVVDSFSRLARSFYDQISTNGQESATLAELRDTLLPKLLSGEIQIGGDENE